MGTRAGSTSGSWRSIRIRSRFLRTVKKSSSPPASSSSSTPWPVALEGSSRTALLRQVWGEEEYIDERTVNVYVQRLRNKLGDDPTNPRLIETVRGFGYRLVRPTS